MSRLYPARRPRRLWLIRLRPRVVIRRIVRWARRHTWKLVSLAVILAVWVVAHVYYFNKLVDLEYNVQAAWAQVEAEQQRRYHIQQNVARLVTGYADHERSLMTRLTELRTSAVGQRRGGAPNPSQEVVAPIDDPDAARAPVDSGADPAPLPRLSELPPGELNRIFPEILFTAEQYPNLRLTENFQQFSQAIIDTETRITERVEIYNERVNVYTTALRQFPSSVFGHLWGFDSYDFYVPEAHTIYFRPIDYPVQAGVAPILEAGASAPGSDAASPAEPPGDPVGPGDAVDPIEAVSTVSTTPVRPPAEPHPDESPTMRGPYRGGTAQQQP